MTAQKQRCIGLLAHVDAGKTTLAEAMLYLSGTLKRLGRVDHRDSFLDTHTLERERGITIFSKQAILDWNKGRFTLLDTPGHADFSAEMERTLRVLDCAVLVISGPDGPQAHTETLWRLLKRYRVPCFLFASKMDLPGADRAAVMEKLQKLDEHCVDFNADTPQRDEQIAMCSEEAMESYLDGRPFADERIRSLIVRRELFPCFFGSGLRLDGVDSLLDALDRYAPETEDRGSFAARVFKIARDSQGNRLTFLKVTGGALKVRSGLDYTGEDQELVEPGKAENGTILYAARPRDESKAYPAVFGEESATNPIIPPDSEDFSEKIPTSKDVGKFEIWYRVDGDDSHSDVPARRLETASIIAPLQPKILIDNVTVKVGEKIKLSPELDEDMAAVYNYLSFNDDVATVGKDGTVKGIGVGTTTVIVGAELKDENPNCKDPDSVDISIKVTKGNNPLKVTAKTAKVKYSKLKKKAQTIKRAKLITVSKKQGTLKYKLVSVKKGNKSFKKYFKINAKTGNVTVKKGLKKGTYKVKVQVKSAGNANYKPSSWKSVKSTVRVK